MTFSLLLSGITFFVLIILDKVFSKVFHQHIQREQSLKIKFSPPVKHDVRYLLVLMQLIMILSLTLYEDEFIHQGQNIEFKFILAVHIFLLLIMAKKVS